MSMIQEARPTLVDFHVAAALDSFPVFCVPPWVLLVPSAYRELSLRFGLLRTFYASWDLRFLFLGVSWCFLRLELFIFLLGFLKVFRIFTVRIWSVFCMIGLGSLVRAFYICLVLPTLRSVLGPG